MDFLDDTKDFKLIISNNKKYVVDYISSKKKLIKYKVMSLTEFRKRYYFDYDNKAVFFLMKKYNMKFANARMFIDNMMAEMFKQLAFTIIVSQISSLIITFLLIPMLSSRIKNMDERSKVA